MYLGFISAGSIPEHWQLYPLWLVYGTGGSSDGGDVKN